MLFAQISDQLISPGATACADYADQSVFLAIFWFVLVIVAFVFSVIFGLLRQKTTSVLFASYGVILVLAKIFFGVDECGHGGINNFSGGYFVSGVALLIFLLTLIFCTINYIVKSNKLKKKLVRK